MDEYEELFDREDDFEEQFADELDALAQMEEESSKPARRRPDDISDIEHLLDDQPTTPKAKRQKQEAGVAKRLFSTSQSQSSTAPPPQSADITPPSSPEQYEPSHMFRSAVAVLDISGFATIPETPRRLPTAAPASLRVLKRPPLEGDYISVTDSSGTRVYLRQKEDAGTKIVDSRLVPNSEGSLGLLAMPISVLREQEAERRHQQVVEESERLTQLLASSVNDVFVEPESREDEENVDPADAEGQTSRLWVDRFSPRHYTELLSDDFTNRCLLKWLKLWDTVVFGRERKSRPARTDRQVSNQHSFKPNQGNQNPNRFKTKIEMTEELLEAELDQYKRPKFKVALLSGPPGLGKTTLAHVIAKHAGYNVVEINASDDRSAEVFQKRIDTATQMKSVLGANERPNCLIIDEIDGAPAISLQQGMKADTGTLMSLCEKTDNDIRSCINTLQFLFGRGHKQLDTKMIQSVSVGQKDQNKGLFHLWQEIFQLPRTKRKRIGQGFEEQGAGSGAQRFQHILHLASSSGEYEKVSQGLYDNYLNMRVRDPNLQNVSEALDWLSLSDRLNHVIMHNQNFSLMKYLPFLSVTFHFLFANTHVPRITYPHSQHDATSRLLSSRNALASMLADIPACIRTRISQLSLTLDVLTLLLDIICPKLRPVNPQLFSTREKEQMRELIDTMLAYNLSYRQDRTPEGQYTYMLEPRIEEVVRFPGLPPHRQLTYQAKQTISREMEQERMRRAEQVMLQRNPTVKEEEKKSSGPKPTRNHQQRLENIVKQTTVETRPEVDFFGRAVAPKPQRAQPSSDTGETCAVLAMGTAVGNSDVWFRFNEGMSNATLLQ
ncbi:hypothetical protein INR49_032847 [Caranx melampygus]|nr:hypothetical protein INR49_032847 [Caranx melampygus]